MTGIKDRRGAYRQGSLRRAGPTHSRLVFKASTRVSKRSSTNLTTTSTLSRLSLSIESFQLTRHKTQPSESTEQRTNGAEMSASNQSPIPTTSASQSHATQPSASSPTSASSQSSIDSERNFSSKPEPSSRPKVLSRKSSGTNIVARDNPHIELQEGDETFEPDDARAMSPRRTSEDLEKMSQDARRQLSQHAKILHESLLEIFNRIDAVKQEHDKLDNNNKFLQKYIGDLMSTSKITATGASGRKK